MMQQTVGASYDISTRKDIWTPEKLPPQVAFTKIKQSKALKVAGKNGSQDVASEYIIIIERRVTKPAPQQITIILVPIKVK